MSPRPRRVALVLPDTVAKVSLVRFEKVPAKRAGSRPADSLAGPQGGAVPDRGCAGRRGCPAIALPGGGREYVVTVARRDIIESYERACEAAGVHAGHRRSGELQPDQRRAGAEPAAPRGDWLLVHVAADYAHAGGRARRRRHVLPQPRRRTATSDLPIWCIRPRCITRIGSAAAGSRASCSPGASLRGAEAGRAAAARARRAHRHRGSSRSTSAAPSRCAIGSRAAPELLDSARAGGRHPARGRIASAPEQVA